MKKNAKKPLLIVLALALVCAASVAGTLAYLTRTTTPVTNTFNAAGFASLKLSESKAVQKMIPVDPDSYEVPEEGAPTPTPVPAGPGQYELDETVQLEDAGNTYTIVPGVDVPKDPRITVTDLEMEAYLFFEAVDTLPDGITWSSTWLPLGSGVTGPNGGDVYSYGEPIAPTASEVFYLINGNEMKVAGDYEGKNDGSEQLKFYAYLCQAAGFDSDLEAWNATFGQQQP